MRRTILTDEIETLVDLYALVRVPLDLMQALADHDFSQSSTDWLRSFLHSRFSDRSWLPTVDRVIVPRHVDIWIEFM